MYLPIPGDGAPSPPQTRCSSWPAGSQPPYPGDHHLRIREVNSVIVAIERAARDADETFDCPVSLHLKDAHYAGAETLRGANYKYPHDYPHYVVQQYLPDNLWEKYTTSLPTRAAKGHQANQGKATGRLIPTRQAAALRPSPGFTQFHPISLGGFSLDQTITGAVRAVRRHETGKDLRSYLSDRDSSSSDVYRQWNINSARVHGARRTNLWATADLCTATTRRTPPVERRQHTVTASPTPECSGYFLRSASYPAHSPSPSIPSPWGMSPSSTFCAPTRRQIFRLVTQVTLNMAEWTSGRSSPTPRGFGANPPVRSRTFAFPPPVAARNSNGLRIKGYHGFEMYDGTVDVEAVAKPLASGRWTLSAPECPAGFSRGHRGGAGVIFHEAWAIPGGHQRRPRQLVFSETGAADAAPCVSAVDDGTIQNAWGLRIWTRGQPHPKKSAHRKRYFKGYLTNSAARRRSTHRQRPRET